MIKILCENIYEASIWCKNIYKGLTSELKKRRISYEKAENAVSCLESAIDSIDCIDFEEITGSLEEATE